MSIFNLHSNVLADYRDFVRSFFSVVDDRARAFIERELVAEARLWPEALLQVSPSKPYRIGGLLRRKALIVSYLREFLQNPAMQLLAELARLSLAENLLKYTSLTHGSNRAI